MNSQFPASPCRAHKERTPEELAELDFDWTKFYIPLPDGSCALLTRGSPRDYRFLGETEHLSYWFLQVFLRTIISQADLQLKARVEMARKLGSLREQIKILLEAVNQQGELCTPRERLSALEALSKACQKTEKEFKKLKSEKTLKIPMMRSLTERPEGASAIASLAIVFGIFLTRLSIERGFLRSSPVLMRQAEALVRKFHRGPNGKLYKAFAGRLRPRFMLTRFPHAEIAKFVGSFLMLFEPCLDDGKIPEALQRLHWSRHHPKSHVRTVLCTAFALEFFRAVAAARKRELGPFAPTVGMRGVFEKEVIEKYFDMRVASMEVRAKDKERKSTHAVSNEPKLEQPDAVSKRWNSVGEKMKNQIVRIKESPGWCASLKGSVI
jgi:hypothetical protein